VLKVRWRNTQFICDLVARLLVTHQFIPTVVESRRSGFDLHMLIFCCGLKRVDSFGTTSPFLIPWLLKSVLVLGLPAPPCILFLLFLS